MDAFSQLTHILPCPLLQIFRDRSARRLFPISPLPARSSASCSCSGELSLAGFETSDRFFARCLMLVFLVGVRSGRIFTRLPQLLGGCGLFVCMPEAARSGSAVLIVAACSHRPPSSSLLVILFVAASMTCSPALQLAVRQLDSADRLAPYW